jgi:hypothetical protein
MSFWNILRGFAVSDKGETITHVSDSISVSSNGTTYTRVGDITYGSDGSFFAKMGAFSSDGSVRMDNTATGLGAVFSDPED